MDDRIIPLLQQAEALKTELDSLRPLDKEREAIVLQKLRLDWNFHSNHLEGNSLTFGETKALILFGITAQGKPLKDHFEITGHDEAIKWVEDIVRKKEPLNENFIRQLHILLLKEPHQIDAVTPDGLPTKKMIKVGEYKSTPNHVVTKTGEIFRFATPEETPAKMFDLLEWYREKEANKETNPILFAADFHYKFIRIHPFDDGNGRMARILMNFILMQYGYPPVIIKTGEKAQYIAALEQADAGIFEPFFEFVITNETRSLELMLKGARGESIEEPDDLDKELALLEQRLKSKTPKIQKYRNEAEIRRIFTEEVLPTSKIFFELNDKFKNFYSVITHYFVIIRNGEAFFFGGNDPLMGILTKIDDNVSTIYLLSKFQNFTFYGYQDRIHNPIIYFYFEDRYKYRIEGNPSGSLTFDYFYHEQINPAHLKAIMDVITKSHKDLIEGIIEEEEKKSQ